MSSEPSPGSSHEKFLDQVRRAGEESSSGPHGESTETLRDVASALPKRIGQYHIKRVIATGGMGTVYEATQERPRRVVALKLMKHGIASRSALRRFEYESQILARLRHAGIAQVYEAGTHKDDSGTTPYFAMEYIPNALPITRYAREKKLGARERMELFAQVCEAVHHGHQKGIIHRDLKPSNILVDSSGQVKIIDFGVARSTDSDLAVTTLQTDVGQLVGTLQYMSPEQCQADPHDIDTRSDVYALGVVFYELLCGRLPYNVTRTAMHGATRIIREQQPTKLSTLNKTLRGDVETIALKALEKERDRRYQSATDLAQDIRRYLNNEAILARPPSVLYQFRVLVRRNKGVFGAIAAVFVVLLGGVLVSTSLYLRSEANRVAAENEANKSNATLEFLVNALRSGDPFVQGEPEPTIRSILNSAAEELDGGVLSDQPEVEARVRKAMAETYYGLALYEDALEQAQMAIELYSKVHGPEAPQTLEAAYTAGSALHRLDRTDEAEVTVRSALERAHAALGPEHHVTLELMYRFASTLLKKGEFDEAEKLMRQLLEVRRRISGDRAETTVDTVHNLAVALLNQGQLTEAEALFREALRIRLAELGEEHPQTSRTMMALSNVSRAQGRYEEMMAYLKRAIRGARASVGDDHVLTRNQVNLLIQFLWNLGRFDEAEPLAREYLDRIRRTPGQEHEGTLFAMNTLGTILLYEGKLDDAERVLGQAKETWPPWERHRDLDRWDRGIQLGILAELNLRKGDLDEAKAFADDALAILREVRDPPWYRYNIGGNLQWGLRVRGEILTRLGRFAEAEAALLEAADSVDEPYWAETAWSYNDTVLLPRAFISLYEAWEAAEPDEGYAEKAAQWRAKLIEGKAALNLGTPATTDPP